MVCHGGSLTAKKTHFIIQNLIPGLPMWETYPQTLYENIDIFGFSDQLVHTQKYLTGTIFSFLVGTLRGVDPPKKMRDVRAIHFTYFHAESFVMRQNIKVSVCKKMPS